MNAKFHRAGFFAGIIAIAAFASTSRAADSKSVTYQNAVVAADHPLASEAGIEILRRGGNVVDAAVATSFALSVVRPESCGIGGGGFMLIWNAELQQGVALDYRERAPDAGTRDMFAGSADSSRVGALAVAVPGTVAGLCFAARRYGTLELDVLLEPALRLAREGIAPDAFARQAQREVLEDFARHPEYRERFAALWNQYLNGGKDWPAEAKFHSPQLPALELIASQGVEGFHSGPVAGAIVSELERGGGIVTKAELSAVQPVVRWPLRAKWLGFDLLTMPPPSSGGIAIIETLQILDAYDRANRMPAFATAKHNSPDYLHLLAEAMKHAFADRAEHLGDADLVPVPTERLTSVEYAATFSDRIDATKTQPVDAYGRAMPSRDAGTSHFSIIDSKGNAVACTETINTDFGSYVVEPQFGIVLNNEMDDFAAVPGQPNAFGLIQSELNAVAPRKKPLSSMSPTVLLKNGEAVAALGGSGGPKIISATLQVLMNLVQFQMDPAHAVAQPRIHHQWLPATLFVEEGIGIAVRESLKTRGHTIEALPAPAAGQAVERRSDGLRGASDPRKGGSPAGY